ncbi:MAG: MBOAT family protein [Clostridium sp.]|nr:MBOAT family protein [Clostridium sp.]
MTTCFLDIEKIRSVLAHDPQSPLMFNTGLFMLLFVAFIFLYHLLRTHARTKMIFVILFSLYFYYKSSAEYCFILLGVCVFDYVLGWVMERFEPKSVAQKICVALNVTINVGMLVWFKYFNLLLETFANFSSSEFDPLDIVLPAGISFFTFRSISYIVDIYRGVIPPCRNFLDYTFYLTFFPPLLAGPVVRAKDMLPQIKENPVATHAMVSEGLFLIMCGLVKKVVVADFVSQNFVDRVFDNPALYSGFENMMAVYGFTIQLYCDFSGYSDMAIGIALLLGFRLFDNFQAPFKAESATEFWHRWHISLSTWLRDYVYIPLGGNRCSKTRKNMNLMATMVVGGLWHGASWMYVIWGAWHGGLLVAHKEMARRWPRLSKFGEGKWWRRALNIFVTFNLVAFAFMFFRSTSMENVGIMTEQILTNFHPGVAGQFLAGYTLIVVLLAGALLFHFLPKSWSTKTRERFEAAPLIVQAVILAAVILLCIQFRQSDIVPFIYLQY